MYGSAGKAAKRATWISAWEAESAGSKAELYAQALLDQAKAFETVPHEHLWKQAAARGYPLRVLAAWRMLRTIGIDASFSRLVKAPRGIPAGSRTATAELRRLIIGLLDVLEVKRPAATIAVYVDAVNVEASTCDSDYLRQRPGQRKRWPLH